MFDKMALNILFLQSRNIVHVPHVLCNIAYHSSSSELFGKSELYPSSCIRLIRVSTCCFTAQVGARLAMAFLLDRNLTLPCLSSIHDCAITWMQEVYYNLRWIIPCRLEFDKADWKHDVSASAMSTAAYCYSQYLPQRMIISMRL